MFKEVFPTHTLYFVGSSRYINVRWSIFGIWPIFYIYNFLYPSESKCHLQLVKQWTIPLALHHPSTDILTCSAETQREWERLMNTDCDAKSPIYFRSRNAVGGDSFSWLHSQWQTSFTHDSPAVVKMEAELKTS